MSDMADARECFAAEPVRADRGEIFKGLQLGCSKAFAKDWQILFLLRSVL
jgi:hypothetical protein